MILLVAVILLFVVAAMAVLAIDIVGFYTARSEAQLAADGAALAGARVMANSGATSDPAVLGPIAQAAALSTASLVAQQNRVGGKLVQPSEVAVTSVGESTYNPRITVRVTRQDLPTFFARIWGRSQITVSASATAEVYNPSGANISLGTGGTVAPTGVKPWLLPNLSPRDGAPIFDPGGSIIDNSLVGFTWPLTARCSSCTGLLGTPIAGQYYPGAIDPDDFPVPARSLPVCSAGFTDYQLAVAASVEKRIACGGVPEANVQIDTNIYPGARDADTVQAVKCLVHDRGADGDSDSIDTLSVPSPPFQYVAGNANPVSSAVSHNVLVSDSLVTVPVYKVVGGNTTSPVQIVGFLQVFLNRTGGTMTTQATATIVNMSGCGETATTQPVLGTGASAIPVRLVADP